MPACLIEQDRRVPPRRDLFWDFGKMQAHRLSVTGRQNERRAHAVAWADGAKDIGRGRALISWRRGSGATPCPTPDDLVLLADARLVSEPDFYVAGIDAFLARWLPDGRGDFFKIFDRAIGLRMMAWTRRELAKAPSCAVLGSSSVPRL